MAENSKIEWTTHTFNPWWGCVEVSAACDHCYARTLGARFGTEWGKNVPRKFFGGKHWEEPPKWNRKAGQTGERPRVFCASMADVFEDNDTLAEERGRLFGLIEATPHLTWLLLTKRPHLMTRFAPESWAGGWPANVWAMTTVEDQTWADARIPWLMKVPAAVRGLSMEPLFGAVTLPADFLALGGKAWVITGGESGPGARPGHPAWYRHLRHQANLNGVPFLFKQWGSWLPLGSDVDAMNYNAAPLWEWPAGSVSADRVLAVNVGEHAAGRTLDGRTWDGVPAATGPDERSEDRGAEPLTF